MTNKNQDVQRGWDKTKSGYFKKASNKRVAAIAFEK